jgi:CheY-like chemotaxis protein
MSEKNVLFFHNDITFSELKKAGFEDIDDWHISTASSIKLVLMKITKNFPDLIILDFDCPEMDGIEILKMIRNYLCCYSPVVIFITQPLTIEKQNILTNLGVLKIILKLSHECCLK